MVDDDSSLFREAVKDAKPLKQERVLLAPVKTRRIPQKPVRGKPSLRVDLLSDDYVPVFGGDELQYLRQGHSPDILRKLRRGHWIVQRQLDLHGFLVDEARVCMVDFLDQCRQSNVRCVRIVHGKGLGSRNREPVLKNKLRSWLMQCDGVIAYTQARQAEGGSGAVVVLLKAG